MQQDEQRQRTDERAARWRRYFDRRPALRYLEVSDHDPFKDAHGYIWQGRRGLAKLSDNEYSRDGWAYARARSQNSGMLDWITADGRLGRGSRRRRAMEIAIEELEARRELERWGRWRRDACVRFVGIVNSPPRCFAWHSDGVRWNEHMVKNNFIFCRVSTAQDPMGPPTREYCVSTAMTATAYRDTRPASLSWLPAFLGLLPLAARTAGACTARSKSVIGVSLSCSVVMHDKMPLGMSSVHCLSQRLGSRPSGDVWRRKQTRRELAEVKCQ